MKNPFQHIMRNSIFRTLPIVVVIFVALALTAFSPFQGPVPDAPPLQVPVWAEMLIVAGLTFLITQGLKSLTAALPNIPNLEGQATAVVAAVVYIIVSVANALLALVPPDYVPLVQVLFTAIGGILSSYGIAGTIKALQPKPKQS